MGIYFTYIQKVKKQPRVKMKCFQMTLILSMAILSAMARDRDRCKKDEDCNVEEHETCAEVYPYLGALFARPALDCVPNGVIPCRINKDCPKGYACNGAYNGFSTCMGACIEYVPCTYD